MIKLLFFDNIGFLSEFYVSKILDFNFVNQGLLIGLTLLFKRYIFSMMFSFARMFSRFDFMFSNKKL